MRRSIDPRSAKLKVMALKRYGFACLVGALITALVLHLPITSADYAGWVQAFGSIGAILYAVSIASNQRRDADRSDIMLRSSRLAAVRGMTEHAVDVVGGATIALLDRNLAENYVANHDAAIFDEAFRMLQQTPMLDLGTVGTVEGVTLIINAIKANLALLHRLRFSYPLVTFSRRANFLTEGAGWSVRSRVRDTSSYAYAAASNAQRQLRQITPIERGILMKSMRCSMFLVPRPDSNRHALRREFCVTYSRRRAGQSAAGLSPQVDWQ
jgi:hypothetical protein